MNLEDRIKRRIAIEAMAWTDSGANNDLVEVEWVDDFEGFAPMDERLVTTEDAARIAALEAEDSANPLAQTQQVRPPLRLNIDIAAFQAVYDDLDHE